MVAAGIAALATVGVGSTGAFFTGQFTSASQTGTAASLAAVPTLTASKAASGQSTNVSWSAPDLSVLTGSGVTGSTTYSLQRSNVNDFSAASSPVTLGTGMTGLGASDTTGDAPVGLNEVNIVESFNHQDGNMAIINGKTYRWGSVYRMDGNTGSGGTAEYWSGFQSGTVNEVTGSPALTESITQLATGRDHACALTVSGKLYCVGWGDFGQLGTTNSSSATSSTAVIYWTAVQDPNGVFTGKTVTQVVSGEYFSCALATDGTVGCWGRNNVGQLGIATSARTNYGAPVKVAQADGSAYSALATYKPIAITAGAQHVCVVKGSATGADGTVTQPTSPVACWGAASNKQLGASATGSTSSTPVDVRDNNGVLTGITTIEAGTDATCVLNDKTTVANVACWGESGLGLTGGATSATAPTTDITDPTTISSTLTGFTSLDLGHNHACASAGSRIQCWGSNYYGQLGNGTTEATAITAPVDVVDTNDAFGGAPIRSVSSGWSHSCATSVSGSVACWGLGSQYQMGQGSATPIRLNTAPVNVLLNGTAIRQQRATAISAGSNNGLAAAIVDKSVYVWGTSVDTGYSYSYATKVAGFPSDVTQLATGASHVCALTASGQVWCAGSNARGQLGNGTTTSSFTAAVQVSTASIFDRKTIVKIASYDKGTCALASDGTIACWGDNFDYAQLGYTPVADVPYSSLPYSFMGPTSPTGFKAPFSTTNKPTDISAGGGTICASWSTGIACWGAKGNGQAGTNQPPTGYYPVPTQIADPSGYFTSGVKALDVGTNSICAIGTGTGRAYCWGGGAGGVLGDGTTGDSQTVKAVQTTTRFDGIATGTGFACGYTARTAECWGDNSLGALGRNTTTGSAQLPSTVVDANFALGGGIVGLSAGATSECALMASGAVACWGDGTGYRTGQGATATLGAAALLKTAAARTVGSAGTCLDGAVQLRLNECSLSPSRVYYYRVDYQTSAVPGWTGDAKIAARS